MRYCSALCLVEITLTPVIVRQLQKYIATNKPFFFVFVDRQKAFDLNAWKAGMESKGPRVNMKKTKFPVSGVGFDVLKKSGMWYEEMHLRH